MASSYYSPSQPPQPTAADASAPAFSASASSASSASSSRRPPPSVQQLVADLVKSGEQGKAMAIAEAAGLLDLWDGLSEEDKVAMEIDGWAWTWDEGDNLRFEWQAPPSLSEARVAWRAEFYRCWKWSFEAGSLQLGRIEGATGGRREWASLPASFPVPTKQRPSQRVGQ